MAIWKPIPSCPEYLASSLGQIRRLPKRGSSGQVLKPWRGSGRKGTGTGYLMVAPRVEGKTIRRLVHRLVAEAFHGLPEEGQVANHRNGDKFDNRPENLEWTTQLANVRHQIEVGHWKPRGPDKTPRSRGRWAA